VDVSSYLERIKTGVSSAVDMKQLTKWVLNNTAHPKIDGSKWSFKDHEYQQEIMNNAAAHLVCRKCSQVGVSEMILRLVLGLVGMLPNHTAIYTLPTSGFSSKFSKTRIDPVILRSKALKELLDPNIDNVELKKIGTSFLYLLGTYTQSGAISIPADILVHDEVDFSDPQALTTFASRLGHAENGGIKRQFSTPTVEGFGISSLFSGSTQAHYGVICDSCNETVFPNFMEHVIVPGMEEPMVDFSKEDLDHNGYDIAGAWLSCPECRNRITEDNLADPDKRRWVHKYPDRDVHGYQIFPYDVIKYNPIAYTLKSIKDYEIRSDWVNFKVGLPDEDATNSFSQEVMDNHTTGKFVLPTVGAATGCVAGIDIGKVSWILIGKPVGKVLNVIYAEQIKQNSEGYLLNRVLELCGYFGVRRGVMDAGPEYSVSSAFVASGTMNKYFANYYVRNKTTSSLSHIQVDEEEGILKTARSVSFDLLVKRVNSGRVVFPQCKESRIIKQHLRCLKRVKGFDSVNEQTVRWMTTGDDHYGQALNYLNIAATLLDIKLSSSVVGSLPLMSKLRLTAFKDEPRVGLHRGN